MYRVAEAVRSTHAEEGAIVLDIRRGELFNLNSVGSKILELLQTGVDEAAIVEEIVRQFTVNRDIAQRDVREFIESLVQHHLLEICGPNGRH